MLPLAKVNVQAAMCHCPKPASEPKIQPHHEGLLMPRQPLPVPLQELAPLCRYSYSWTKNWCCSATAFYKVQWEHTNASVCVGYRAFCFAKQLSAFHDCLSKAHLTFLLPLKGFLISMSCAGTFGNGWEEKGNIWHWRRNFQRTLFVQKHTS